MLVTIHTNGETFKIATDRENTTPLRNRLLKQGCWLAVNGWTFMTITAKQIRSIMDRPTDYKGIEAAIAEDSEPVTLNLIVPEVATA